MPFVAIVTAKQRNRRPTFIATLSAAASWLSFRVARSSRPTPVLRWRHGRSSVGVQNRCRMLVARALKNSELTRQPPGERHAISATGH